MKLLSLLIASISLMPLSTNTMSLIEPVAFAGSTLTNSPASVSNMSECSISTKGTPLRSPLDATRKRPPVMLSIGTSRHSWLWLTLSNRVLSITRAPIASLSTNGESSSLVLGAYIGMSEESICSGVKEASGRYTSSPTLALINLSSERILVKV